MRFEFDLCRGLCGSAKLDPLSGENDWLRMCPAEFVVPNGEVMTKDLGRTLEAAGPGDGDGDPRSKRLLRHRAPPGAVVDMMLTIELKGGRWSMKVEAHARYYT